MNKYKINISIFAALVLLLSACSEKILDKTPLDKYSDATVWSDVSLANSYLNDCYNRGILGQFGHQGIASVADETTSFQGYWTTPYVVGLMNADNTWMAANYMSNWFTNSNWGQFTTIQKINLFLEKIDIVPDAYSQSLRAGIKAQTDILKGEALFLRAFIYTELCRTYGGLPIMGKANKLGDDFSKITRATFKETVEFIVADCDAAAQLLPLKANQALGRATKEAALSIKSRILLFAASDLTADGTAVNELVGYNNPDRIALWTAARDAAKAVMDLHTCELADFGAPDKKAVSEKYWAFFKAYDLSNKEVIFGIQYEIGKKQHSANQTQGPNGNNNFGWNAPWQNMVDEYEMEDGSKYSDHYTLDANKYIKNISTKYHHESPYYDREPRFYASILYDSALFQPRLANNAARDPLGIFERRTHRTIAADGKVTDVYGIDTRQATIFPAGGNIVGYLTKKFMDPTVKGINEANQNVWIEIRYAEILFNYAEACLELGDIPTATTYINMIRNRAALPDFTGDITEALRHERKVELFSEGFRWYDIRRWKIMPQVFVPCNVGVDIIETFNVATGIRKTTWQFIDVRVPNVFIQSMYWIPIQTAELKRATQLVQNPGY